MSNIKDFFPLPPDEGPPIPRFLTAGNVYWIRILDGVARKTLYEYDSVFTDADEAAEDAFRKIIEGAVPSPIVSGYRVRVYDTHPDVPCSKLLVERIV